jgi:ferredoxin
MNARSVLRLCGLLCVLLTVGGCNLSPLEKRVAAFSTAASATTLKMTSSYALVEQSYTDAQSAKLVNNFDKNGFKEDDYQPFMPVEAMKVRTQLLKGLEQYATLLAEVTGTASVSAIDKQSQATGKSLQSLAKDSGLAAMAGDAKLDSGTVSSAVDALGHALAEEKTAKELPSILDSMKQPVDNICQLLVQDIGTPEGSGLRNQLRNDYQQIIADQRTYIYANEAKMTATEKRAAIELLPTLVAKEKQDDATLAATAEALKKLATTNDALVETKKSKDSPAFHTLLSSFEAQGQQVGSACTAASKCGSCSTATK